MEMMMRYLLFLFITSLLFAENIKQNDQLSPPKALQQMQHAFGSGDLKKVQEVVRKIPIPQLEQKTGKSLLSLLCHRPGFKGVSRENTAETGSQIAEFLIKNGARTNFEICECLLSCGRIISEKTFRKILIPLIRSKKKPIELYDILARSIQDGDLELVKLISKQLPLPLIERSPDELSEEDAPVAPGLIDQLCEQVKDYPESFQKPQLKEMLTFLLQYDIRCTPKSLKQCGIKDQKLFQRCKIQHQLTLKRDREKRYLRLSKAFINALHNRNLKTIKTIRKKLNLKKLNQYSTVNPVTEWCSIVQRSWHPPQPAMKQIGSPKAIEGISKKVATAVLKQLIDQKGDLQNVIDNCFETRDYFDQQFYRKLELRYLSQKKIGNPYTILRSAFTRTDLKMIQKIEQKISLKNLNPSRSVIEDFCAHVADQLEIKKIKQQKIDHILNYLLKRNYSCSPGAIEYCQIKHKKLLKQCRSNFK